MSTQTLEERINSTFDPEYSEFLLEDVGFVKFHRFSNRPKENWGIIESHNGDVLFFTLSIREYQYDGSSRPVRKMPELTGPLQQGQPVTFTLSHDREGKRLRSFEVALWQPERFNTIRMAIGDRPVYRLISTRPECGGLGASQGRVKNEVLWKGKNLETLCRMFPSDRWPVRAGDVSGRHFERLNRETKEWELCDDPR